MNFEPEMFFIADCQGLLSRYGTLEFAVSRPSKNTCMLRADFVPVALIRSIRLKRLIGSCFRGAKYFWKEEIDDKSSPRNLETV